jgi:hypothetical protein
MATGTWNTNMDICKHIAKLHHVDPIPVAWENLGTLHLY